LTNEKIEQIQALWNDPGICSVFEANEFSLQLGYFSYWMTRLEKIKDANFVPDFADILRVYEPTVDVQETKLEHELSSFVVVDTSGQSTVEGLQAMECLQDVAVLCIVISLNANNEQGGQNALEDELNRFGKMVNMSCFKNSAIVLILNKIDVLQLRKSKLGPSSVCIPNFQGEGLPELEEVVSYFQGEISRRFKDDNSSIYIQRMWSTNTHGNKRNVDAIMDIIFRSRIMKDSLE
jgi:hypothetical protein